MTPFELRMRPAPSPAEGPPFATNQEILAAWRSYQETRLQEVTLEHYGYEVRAFLAAWSGTLVTRLHPRDLRAYLIEYGKRCQFFRRQGFPISAGPACTKKQDLTACGKGTCPLYTPLLFQSVEKHLQALVSLYDFLVAQEAVPHNFVRDVKREWIKENRHQYRQSSKRLLKPEEVRSLVERASAPNRQIFYAILAKTGARYKETVLLRVDSDHMNLKEGWLKVPDFPGKRRGNRYLVVDAELKRLLQAYLVWRQSHVQRDEAGRPLTDILILNYRGEPFDAEDETAILQKVVTRDCVRLGLMRPKEPVANRITPHRFRHYFSDQIKKNGLDSYWWNVLRGDLPRGNEKTYVHPTLAEIQQMYRAYAPLLGPAHPRPSTGIPTPGAHRFAGEPAASGVFRPPAAGRPDPLAA